jgi:hypothetical protein
MGTTLTGTTPQDTYDSLIKVTDNGPLSGSLKTLTDGLGNDSALALSTGAARVTGTLAVTTGTISGTDAIAISAVNTNTNGTTFALNSAGTVGIMTFLTASTERMRITSAGNVGINESSPSTKLELLASATVSLTGNTYYSARFLQDKTNYRGVFFGYDTTGTIGVIGAETASPASALAFYTYSGSSWGERARITTNGLTFNGDTAAANALDDYEEGTWTMGVSFGGASVGVTYNGNTGTYTKIGRQVTVNGYLALTSKGSSTGNALLTGLPFTIGNSASNFSVPSFWFNNITFTNQFQGYANYGTTTILLQEITVLGSNSSLTNADFANNSEIMVSLTYFV